MNKNINDTQKDKQQKYLQKRQEFDKALNDFLDELFDAGYEFENEDKLPDLWDEVNECACEAFGIHDWVFDQCGFWQHQYCLNCETAKYPEFIKKSCGEMVKEMGGMTEEEYKNRS